MTLLAVALPCLAAMPSQRFFTYLGLVDCDAIAAWHNNIFLACHSFGDQLPSAIQGGQRPDRADAYVVRIDPRKNQVIYATRIGGSKYSAAFRIEVDSRGYAYAVGITDANDFPTTPDAVQKQFGGGKSDAFLVVVAPDGKLYYSTFLGGSGRDEGDGLALDGSGGVFVAGTTWSNDFPGQQKTQSADQGKAFISHLKIRHPGKFGSTVFGGSAGNKLTGIALDGQGGLFAVGTTKSKDFPLVEPIQTELRGSSDLFLTRVRLADFRPTFSTYFGGSQDESGWGVAVDRHGNPTVAGVTNSTDLPTSSKAFQHSLRGGKDVFIAKFYGPGYRKLSSTYFGGTRDDWSGADGDDIKIDAADNIWLVGYTASHDLPMRHALHPLAEDSDQNGFIAAFSPQLTELCYSSYLGGRNGDDLEGLAIAGDGNVLASGFSFSTKLPADALVNRKSKTVLRLDGKSVHAVVLEMQAAGICR